MRCMHVVIHNRVKALFYINSMLNVNNPLKVWPTPQRGEGVNDETRGIACQGYAISDEGACTEESPRALREVDRPSRNPWNRWLTWAPVKTWAAASSSASAGRMILL